MGELPGPNAGAAVRLRLVVGSTEPVAGSIGREGEPADLPFVGWLELMAAVNSLCAGTTEASADGA